MINLKKAAILGISLVLFLGSAPAAFAKELNMGYFILSPHVTRVENGKPVGSLVDWFNQYVAPEMSDTVVWSQRALPVPRLLAGLKNGTVDAAILFAKNSERAAYLYYPEESYLETISALLVRNDFPYQTIDSLDMIKQIKIGYGTGAFIPPPIRNANLKFDLVASSNFYEVNTKKLMGNRVDALFDPQDIVLAYTARVYGIENQTRIVNLPGAKIGSYTVFSKKANDQSTVDQYQQALAKAKAKIQYSEFVKQWNDPGQ